MCMRRLSDEQQMTWLRKRLAIADKQGTCVVLLFHIPKLVDGALAHGPKLTLLHEMIATSQSVKAVICGHIHNFQEYSSETFKTALQELTGKQLQNQQCLYYVSGGGGAFLSVPPPDSTGLPYKPRAVFPSLKQWEDLIGATTPQGFESWRSKIKRNLSSGRGSLLRKAMARTRARFTKPGSAIDHLLAQAQEGTIPDPDKANFLSLLYLEIWPDRTTITPVYLEDLGDIYGPNITHVTILNRNPLPEPELVLKCYREQHALEYTQ